MLCAFFPTRLTLSKSFSYLKGIYQKKKKKKIHPICICEVVCSSINIACSSFFPNCISTPGPPLVLLIGASLCEISSISLLRHLSRFCQSLSSTPQNGPSRVLRHGAAEQHTTYHCEATTHRHNSHTAEPTNYARSASTKYHP